MTALMANIGNCAAISIHIPRVGDDADGLRDRRVSRISIHIPRVGDDLHGVVSIRKKPRFQSTSPVWGMTSRTAAKSFPWFISIHIPRVGDDDGILDVLAPMVISIHIPRVGDDPNALTLRQSGQFQSTSPVWGMTSSPNAAINSASISIHIPRVGDDETAMASVYRRQPFQSTSPVWGMTTDHLPDDHAHPISIHIPRVGDDRASVRT